MCPVMFAKYEEYFRGKKNFEKFFFGFMLLFLATSKLVHNLAVRKLS